MVMPRTFESVLQKAAVRSPQRKPGLEAERKTPLLALRAATQINNRVFAMLREL
jgi:hypothetical protein